MSKGDYMNNSFYTYIVTSLFFCIFLNHIFESKFLTKLIVFLKNYAKHVQSRLLDSIDHHFYKDNDIRQIENDENEEKKENKPERYEDKYLELLKKKNISIQSNHNKVELEKERLDELKNCIIIEKTPLGNVLMFYNNSRSSFEYYSDNTIPYRYLEVVCRKYVLTYNCSQIYVDMELEIEEAEKKLKDKKDQQKKEDYKQDDDSNVLSSQQKNVFVKFKNYNKNTNIKNSSVPVERQVSKKSKKEEEEKIIKEKANRYSYEGKFANYNFLKKVDRKITDKRYNTSFSDFKKMQKNVSFV